MVVVDVLVGAVETLNVPVVGLVLIVFVRPGTRTMLVEVEVTVDVEANAEIISV